MVWFFQRGDASVRLETRYDNETAEFVVNVKWLDGRENTERFTDREEYRLRLVALENSFEIERWVRRGPPMILQDGWPNKRLT